MDNVQYEKIVWQLKVLLDIAEENLDTYSFQNFNVKKVKVLVSGKNAFTVSTVGFTKSQIMGDVEEWYNHIISYILSYKPELQSKLQPILDSPKELNYRLSGIDDNTNYYLPVVNNDPDLIVLRQYTFVDLHSGHDHVENAPGNTQRADRLINNPAYNADLYINGKLLEFSGLPIPNPYSNLTKDSLLRLPNNVTTHEHNEQTMNIYSSKWVPQFLDGVVKKFEATMGYAKTLPNLNDPILNPIANATGEDSGETVQSFGYIPTMDEPLFTEFNHHTVDVTANSNGLYLVNIIGYLAAFGISSTDVDLLAFLQDTANRLPPQRDLQTLNCRIVDLPVPLPSPFGPAKLTIAGHFPMGSEYTPVTFPDGYGVFTGAGDVYPGSWHWNMGGPGHAHPPTGNSNYLQTNYYVDVDLKKLYEQKVALVNLVRAKNPNVAAAIPDASIFVQSIFTNFGLNFNYSRKLAKDLNITWAAMGQFPSAVYHLPIGKSVSISYPDFVIPCSGRIVLTYPHTHDHCSKLQLLIVKDGVRTKVTSTYPKNKSTAQSLHDAVPEYGYFGNKTPGYAIHNHPTDCPANLSIGGLAHSVYAPGSNGPIFDESKKTHLVVVAHNDNPHDQMIDQMSIYFVYFEKLDI